MNLTGLQQNFVSFVDHPIKEGIGDHKRFFCEKCRFSTKDVELFERHVAHHEEVTFSCSLCNHVSYSRVESQRHIAAHKGSFPYKCNWCSYGAVRRDYMVKHIQRIHGNAASLANGGFTIDYALSPAKVDHVFQKQTTELFTSTSSAPEQNVKFVPHSTENMLSLLPSTSQSSTSAPYLVVRPVHHTTSNDTHLICSTTAQPVTSTTCILPVTKTVGTPYNVHSTSHTVSKVTQGFSNPNVMVNDVDPRLSGKTSSGKAVSPGALPRVHVSIPADRAFQQKTFLQSQVAATTEKTVIQSKTVPKKQSSLVGGNNPQLKTLLSTPVESFGQKAVEAQNVPAALLAQRSFHTGVIRSIPVANAVQGSIPPGAHPSTPVERFRQRAPYFTLGTQNTEKTNRRRMRPNILVKRPSEKLKQSPQPSVQVELLAPLNQPIQHNKPLTVKCPEEITIPAGCLVELVEVKSVNGTRELELRLVPQQTSGPQLETSKITNTAGTNSSISIKYKVPSGDNPTRHVTSNLQANAIPVPQVKGPHLKEHSTVATVEIKDEPEVIEQVLSSKRPVSQAPGNSKGVSRSVTRTSESQIIHQSLTGHKNVAKATELVTPVRQSPFRGGTTSHSAKNKHFAVKGMEHALGLAQAKKLEDLHSGCQGLPVISSVFSLCPNPEVTLNGIRARERILDKHVVRSQVSPDSGSQKSVANVDSVVSKPDLKEEEDAGLLTGNIQKLQERNDHHLQDTRFPDCVVSEENPQTFLTDLKGKTMPKMCGPSINVVQTTPTGQSTVIEPISDNNSSSQCILNEKTKSLTESSLLMPKESLPTLPMNPTVALPRIPSLDFYSLLESGKDVVQGAAVEESITARPVLCRTSNQQNMQERAIKLVLKRRRSETENKDSGSISQPLLECFDVQSPYRKHKKKRSEKYKPSKVMLELHEIFVRGRMEKLWLTPLKEDQLVKVPAPDQPVVVLNHPNPLVQMVSEGVEAVDDYTWVDTAHGVHTKKEAIPDEFEEKQCPSFKMKLKKVQGRTYQVTELVLKGVSEKMAL